MKAKTSRQQPAAARADPRAAATNAEETPPPDATALFSCCSAGADAPSEFPAGRPSTEVRDTHAEDEAAFAAAAAADGEEASLLPARGEPQRPPRKPAAAAAEGGTRPRSDEATLTQNLLREAFLACDIDQTGTIGRRRACHLAGIPSPVRKCFNRNGEGVPAK